MHSEEEEKGELDERRSSTALSSLKLGGTYEERKSSGVIISDRLGMHEGDTGLVSNRTYSQQRLKSRINEEARGGRGRYKNQQQKMSFKKTKDVDIVLRL